jgi:hypothetical protein
MNERLKQQQQSVELDMQAKCAKDAHAWFNQNYRQDKETAFLDYSNHYNRSLNKCFILVQHNWWLNPSQQLISKDVIAYDVYENLEMARSGEIKDLDWRARQALSIAQLPTRTKKPKQLRIASIRFMLLTCSNDRRWTAPRSVLFAIHTSHWRPR